MAPLPPEPEDAAAGSAADRRGGGLSVAEVTFGRSFCRSMTPSVLLASGRIDRALPVGTGESSS